MAPKKKSPRRSRKRANKRDVGVLGLPIDNSDEDEDWTPDKASGNPPQRRPRRLEATAPERDGSSTSASGHDDVAGVPLAQRRMERQMKGASPIQATKRPRRTAAQRPLPRHSPAAPAAAGAAPKASSQRQPEAPSRRRRAVAAPGAGAPAAAVAVAAQPLDGSATPDWGALTAPLLAEVLRRACASSALPTAASAPCVCRHWRAVCLDLEDQAVRLAEAAAAGVAAALMAEAQAAAMAAAADNAAVKAQPTAAVVASAAGGSGGTSSGLAAATTSLGPVPGPGPGVALSRAAEGALVVGGGGRAGDVGALGLWSCLDVRSRPSARLDDGIVAAGARMQRWLQVRTLRLGDGGSSGLTADGLAALAAGCPALTALELTQCDSLIKPDTMRSVFASLPRLTQLDLSHCALLNVDAIVKMALAPRAAAPYHHARHHQPQQSRLLRRSGAASAGASAGAVTGSGAGGGWALPCSLRVLRLRGCPRLGAGAFKALTPDVPYMTLPPYTEPAGGGAATGSAATAVVAPVVPLLVHLRELDLTGSGAAGSWDMFAVERLQAAAPKLRVLRLDAAGAVLYGYGLVLGPEPRQPGPGFPHLRILELGLSRSTTTGLQSVSRGMCTLELLRRVAGASPHLRVLDVSGAMSGQDHSTLREVALATRLGFGPSSRESDDDGRQEGEQLQEEEEDESRRPGVPPRAHLHPGRRALAALRAEEEAVKAAVAMVAARGLLSEGDLLRGVRDSQLSCALAHSLGHRLRGVLPDAPLRVLRASRSLLASDAALRALAQRFGGTLQVLDVSESTHVTDAGLLHVAFGCTALTSLDVSSTAITDWGVRCLLALASFEEGQERRGAVEAGLGGSKRRGDGASGGLQDAAPGAAGEVRKSVLVPGSSSRRAPSIIELLSDSDSDGGDDNDDDGGKGDWERREPDRRGRKGTRGLQHLDIRSCRGVTRDMRHAAAEGLVALRRLLLV